MTAKFRLSLRHISAIIVLPLIMVACGQPNSENIQGDQAITLGKEIVFDNKFLYDGTMSTVFISQFFEFKDENGLPLRGQYNCSGTIIAKNIILTAAHCLMRPFPGSDIIVEFPFTQQSVKHLPVVDLVRHEKYDEQMKANDLMLLKLESNVPSDYVPMKIGRLAGYVPRGNLSLFGFGKSKSPNLSWTAEQNFEEAKLRTVVVELFARENGFLKFDQRRNGGSCKGDSGGPAVMKDGYTPVLVGVSSNIMPNLTDAQNREISNPRTYNGNVEAYLRANPSIELCRGYAFYVDLELYQDWIKDGLDKLR